MGALPACPQRRTLGRLTQGSRVTRLPSRRGRGQYPNALLDQAGTVTEALGLLDGIEILMVSAHGHDATLHLAMEDATGDSAIVEYVEGKRVVHHGRQFTLMTNDPTYDEQLALLAKQDFSHPSREMPLPGNVNPVDRFQRRTGPGSVFGQFH